MKRRFILLGSACLAFCLPAPVLPAEPTAPAQKVREPAVAGIFYPAAPGALAQAVDRYLAAAPAASPGRLKALICPHAGYEFSGPVAAAGFRLLRGQSFDTVVVLAPSHYAYLRAASVSAADVFRTPLGDVPISRHARELAQLRPFELEPACAVQTPPWAGQSPHHLPRGVPATADTWEHADEVEVPFLQRTLDRFQLVPVVVGDVDPSAAARALDQILDTRTLLVASSDLSHYHSYADANARDRRCIDAICALDADWLGDEEACGRIPIQILLQLARQHGWHARLLDYRNSGDTAGSRDRVVGYAAIAFYEPAPADGYSPAERRQLLSLARRALRTAAESGGVPDATGAGLPPNLAEPRACFVTLTVGGELRGCIGNLEPRLPLWRAVMDNARNAALHDPRFRAVRPAEVDAIAIEISVLTKPEPLAFRSPEDLLRQLRPGEDGVVLQLPDGGGATFLPQVWEQIPDKMSFLDRLAEKAGSLAGDWRRPGTTVSIYHVEAFKEADFARK
ncbi:MAG TPA: AmmeMemoRadiSam system protein B [Lacunisphaera sp.]|nr:AmmeMemoRadiSam system protein B [Lacunisphaera sp.]